MRLHKLEITAFGPFAETAVVDFDTLGADGLFLLHGQTGAGKTTILDAIAFALYGTVPGARKEAKRLRSDHAPVGVVPKVALEATLGGRRVRLARSPDYARLKRDGSGMRTQPASATLTWLDGEGQNLSRIPEIGDEVLRLVGMSADQFFQVVLLPQGDFARFLRTDNDDREQLLERLFDTERFGTAEEWLAEKRRKGAAALDAERAAIDQLVAKVCQAAEVGEALPGSHEEQFGWATGLLTNARAELAVASGRVETFGRDADEAADELAHARRIADLHRRRGIAREQLDAFDAGTADRAERAAVLARANRAVPASAAIAEAAEARRAADAAVDVVARQAERLAGIEGGLDVEELPDLSGESSLRLDNEIQAWTAELGRLGDLVAEADTADRLAAEHRQCVTDAEQAEATMAAARAARAELPELIVDAEAALGAAREAAATVPAHTADCDRAKAVAAAAVEMAGLRAKLERAAVEYERLRVAHSDAREHELDLRERRLAGMAAELAAGLVDGDPCQVCGATEHPAPAAPIGDPVSDAEEHAAVAAERKAAQKRDGAGAVVTELRGQIEACAARGGDGDPAELAARLEEVSRQLATAKRLAAEAEPRAVRVTELRGREEELGNELRALGQKSATLEAVGNSLAVRLAELREQLRVAAGGDESVRHRHARIAELVGSATDLRRFRESARSGCDSAAALAARAETVLRDAGFADADEVSAAHRDTNWLKDTEYAIEAANNQRAHAVAVLAEPDIAALSETEPADVDTLVERVTTAKTAHTTAVAAHAEAQGRARQLEALTVELWTAVDRFAPVLKRQAELTAVADLVAGRGENTRRMSLRSYVLAARLEEVALAGSARLRRMSGGRYEFVHSDAAGPRGKRGGLGLDVRDDYTGEVRPAKSLSGGETFLASLALALGLADTVAEHCGGRVLDTMFIDEGFGTLDSETLDSVMGVLDELRAGGRVVGIVSHVDEMRQRIPSRLHVIRGRAGSRLAPAVTG
ncbi:AAA family ATPase [Aldersonia kunmingensis]|uniref:AAA family ATPase n=1 Tax=Aldersonia kunmingensis TaxID=408066 RepID=UPI00082C625F|nr:SMC family ATPase [Aldersonia kunmingensis]